MNVPAKILVFCAVFLLLFGLFFFNEKQELAPSSTQNHRDKNILPSSTPQPTKQSSSVAFTTIRQKSIALTPQLYEVHQKPARAETPAEQDRFELKVTNHSRLLVVQQDITEYHQELREGRSKLSPHSGQVKDWAYILYKDALSTRLEEQALPDEISREIQDILDSPNQSVKLDLLQESSPHLSSRYLGRLQKMLASVFELDPEILPIEVQMAVPELRDLLKRRKRYSENYFKTKMRSYFKDDAVMLSEKVNYMEDVKNSGDLALVQYGRGYFVSLEQNGNLSPEDTTLVENLIGALQ